MLPEIRNSMQEKEVYPNRKSTRLQGYDYSQAGAYFVSITTYHRTKYFGKIVEEKITLDEAGKMVQDQWLLLPEHFPNLQLDEFIVMSDHFHAVLFLTESEVRRRAPEGATTRVALTEESRESTTKGGNPNLGQVIGAFKSITTKNFISGVKERGWKTFKNHIWHRNYHDRIIRNEKELNNIRKFIRYNPYHLNNDIYAANPSRWGLSPPKQDQE